MEETMYNTNTNSNGITFDQWFYDVNQAVLAKAGIGIKDIADGPAVECWEDGYTPGQYAIEQLMCEGILDEYGN
tara:strand:+ start:584 stop:805 length:222 start_codon:yes stop_codon:yes gene_type:complete